MFTNNLLLKYSFYIKKITFTFKNKFYFCYLCQIDKFESIYMYKKTSLTVRGSKLLKKRASKGDRLRWTPIKEIKSAKLMEHSFSGKLLSDSELNERKRNTQNTNLLVP